MNHHVDIQHASLESPPISDAKLTEWVTSALATTKNSAEITLRIVNVDEMTQLNHTYRQKNKPTNVLAFPSNIPAHIALEYPFLGDVIVCPDVLKQESLDLTHPLEAYWALIVIHGTLHLLGYDHIEDHEAEIMQALEVALLTQQGFTHPHADTHDKDCIIDERR
jgi:probable rRNA maturation factor